MDLNKNYRKIEWVNTFSRFYILFFKKFFVVRKSDLVPEFCVILVICYHKNVCFSVNTFPRFYIFVFVDEFFTLGKSCNITSGSQLKPGVFSRVFLTIIDSSFFECS